MQPVSAAELQSRVGRVRSVLRGGDAEGALREALMSAVYGDVQGKVCILFSLGWRRGLRGARVRGKSGACAKEGRGMRGYTL